MTWFVDFLREVAFLTCETAPYLLVGFFLAGMIKVFVPPGFIYGNLGGNNLKSVLRASLYGIPLPLCSCSVIPTATSLKRAGASKGATASFLISTPETGVDSISVTYALLDPIMTVLRPVVALVTALFTGSVVSLFVRRGWDNEGTGGLDEARCGHDHDHDHGHDHGHDHDHAEEEIPDGAPFAERMRGAFRYAFGPLLDDLTRWLLIGFSISALIALLIPDDLFVETVPAGWPSMLLMMVIATPVYMCATASTPIAAVLIAKGLDPGAALVFLLVGPATNITTVLVVMRLLGSKALVIYLAGITGVALLAGWLVGQAYTLLRLDLAAVVTESLATEPGPVMIVSGIVLAFLLLRSASRIGLWSGWRWRAALSAVAVLYVSTSVTIVYPGDSGWILRFGDVARSLEEPGAYLHWPYPIDRAEVVAGESVRSVDVGFDARDPRDDPRGFRERARQLEDEAEVMAGDGTLLRITYSVHFRWRDAYRVRFAVEDDAALTRAFAEAAMRQTVARQPGSDWLVSERLLLAGLVEQRLRSELDSIDSGIEVASVNVRDVHAPADVHDEYRDVASALEDRERVHHEAQGERAEMLQDAAAAAYEQEQEAAALRDGAIQEASGETARFLHRLGGYRDYPQATRLRKRLAVTEQALGRARLFALLGDDIQLELLDSEGGPEVQQGLPSSLDRVLQNLPPGSPKRSELEEMIREGR